MTEHTPGPWEVVGQHVFTKLGATNAHGSKASDRDGWNIATITPWSCTNQDDEEEYMPVSEVMANAALIAAAPELLEALESICAMQARNYGDATQTHLDLPYLTDKARAAIAKARGQS